MAMGQGTSVGQGMSQAWLVGMNEWLRWYGLAKAFLRECSTGKNLRSHYTDRLLYESSALLVNGEKTSRIDKQAVCRAVYGPTYTDLLWNPTQHGYPNWSGIKQSYLGYPYKMEARHTDIAHSLWSFGPFCSSSTQRLLGWDNFVLGRWVPEWRHVQVIHYKHISSRKSSLRWAAAVIHRLFLFNKERSKEKQHLDQY